MSSISAIDLASIYELLTRVANRDNFWSLFEAAFGSHYDAIAAENLRSQWQAGEFRDLPQIEVVSSQLLGSATGAYASSTNIVYLSDQFVATAGRDSLEAVLLEEFGHFVDAYVNSSDSAGDEGEIFTALVLGESLSDDELKILREENDWAIVKINGEDTEIEQASFSGDKNDNVINGTDQGDFLSGQGGNDLLNGGAGNDNLDGGTGNDILNGDAGIDYLRGNEGDDMLNGGEDRDVLYGGIGNDVLFGGLAGDYLYGDDGDDILIGADPSIDDLYIPGSYGGIQDSFYGGPGKDIFVLGNAHKTYYSENGTVGGGGSRANLFDFNRNEDIIQLHGSSEDYLLWSRIEVNYPTGLTYLELKNPHGSGYEIIAILYGQTDLSLTDSYFQYATKDQAVFSPAVVGTFDTPANAESVQVVGDYAYVADGGSGLQIIDIRNPRNPALKGSYPRLQDSFYTGLASSYHSVKVSGNYAYIAAGIGGIHAVNIRQPETPYLVGTFNKIGYASKVFIGGGSAYLNTAPTLSIVDVGDPTDMTIFISNPAYVPGNDVREFIYSPDAGQISGFSTVNDIYVDSLIYIATGGGLAIFRTPPYPNEIDFKWSEDPKETNYYVGTISFLSGLGFLNVKSIQNSGYYTYLIANGKLLILDINIIVPRFTSEPFQIVASIKGAYALPSDAKDLQVVDNIVYVANGNSGLYIIDVSDPTNPTFKGSYDTSGTANDVWIENNYAYVADGESGIQIIDLFAKQAPTNITLSNNAIAENQALEQVIGNLSSVDANIGDVFVYSLVAGSGSTDNAQFTIQNGQLKSKAVFDYETQNSYNIRIRSTDQDGGSAPPSGVTQEVL